MSILLEKIYLQKKAPGYLSHLHRQVDNNGSLPNDLVKDDREPCSRARGNMLNQQCLAE